MKPVRSIWIFQANPKRFRIVEALNNPKYVWDNWRVTRYENEIKNGDLALIWVGGKDAGIYAVADIVTDPRYTNEEFPLNRDEYFPKTQVGQEERVQDEDRNILKVKVNFINKFINRPLYKNDLVNIPGLDRLSVITMPRATNFKVIESEWKIISKLISAY